MKIKNKTGFCIVGISLSAIIMILTGFNGYAQRENLKAIQVKVSQGLLEGRILPSGINVFRGIPFAAPPVGPLRWKAPEPVAGWKGVRMAVAFGARPVQKSGLLYEFRSETMSEDCLYLNVWSGDLKPGQLSPVYVFIHGGSFIHGDGSQPAYDGESMARQGVVFVSINYRLGVFGFLSHPELAGESPNRSSGNYGLLDQLAALKWVKDNIAAFGGDPNRITLGGESVGAQSVSAHMASPLSRGLIHSAIAESSSLLDSRELIRDKKESEDIGIDFLKMTKTTSILQARSLSYKRLLKVASKGDPRRFKPTVDGYFLREFPVSTFESGKQAKIPLLVGWNADEVPALAFYRLHRASPENFRKRVEKIYGDSAKYLLAYYPVSTNQQARSAGSKLASDWLINYGSWRLVELHSRDNEMPVYRYLFTQPHPGLTPRAINSGTFFQTLFKRIINKTITGTAFHAAEIEYALGNLDVQRNYAWKADDYKVSAQMQGYFVNFIKTGNPNGQAERPPLPTDWPQIKYGKPVPVMKIGVNGGVELEPETTRSRYLLLQKLGDKK